MIKRFIKLASIGALIVHAGCRSEAQSVLKDDTEVHDDFRQQTATMQLTCPETAMIVLVGSSESMSQVEAWNISSPSLEETEAGIKSKEDRFKESIDRAHLDLKTALARNPNCKTELLYAAIMDGPGMLDSKIETVHYRYVDNKWQAAAAKYWQLTGDQLQQSRAAFELDTSRDVTKIVRILASNKFAKISESASLSKGSDAPDQIAYIIKAHGSRVATTDRILPSLESMKEQSVSPLLANEWEPAILADTNGPSGRLRSPVFAPKWSTQELTRVFGEGGQAADDTAGERGSAWTTGDGGGDASTGKSLVFSEAILGGLPDTSEGRTRFGAYATYGTPHTSGISRLGLPVPSKKIAPNSGITQNKNPTTDRAPLSLTGDSKPLPKNLIILDSCYGSEKIMSALEYQGPGSGNNTVVLASVSPIYFDFLDYSKLGLADLLKFPALLERLKAGTNLTAEEKALLKNMDAGTLATSLSHTQNSDHKKLTIWID